MGAVDARGNVWNRWKNEALLGGRERTLGVRVVLIVSEVSFNGRGPHDRVVGRRCTGHAGGHLFRCTDQLAHVGHEKKSVATRNSRVERPSGRLERSLQGRGQGARRFQAGSGGRRKQGIRWNVGAVHVSFVRGFILANCEWPEKCRVETRTIVRGERNSPGSSGGNTDGIHSRE